MNGGMNGAQAVVVGRGGLILLLLSAEPIVSGNSDGR